MEFVKIKLKNTKNTRSLSHLINKEGKHIVPHLLIRSDALHSIDKEDQEILVHQYHLKRVIDFRSCDEATLKPDVNISGVEYCPIPVLPNEKIGISKKGNLHTDFSDFIRVLKENGIQNSIAYMKDIYQQVILSDFSFHAYQKFLKTLLVPVDGATLWHCSAGKDRAGFATVLILSILDFKEEDIWQDYLSTNQYYLDNVLELKKIYGDDYEEILWSVFGVREEYIEIIKNSIASKYGSMDGYIRAMGITDEERKKLKNMYLGV